MHSIEGISHNPPQAAPLMDCARTFRFAFIALCTGLAAASAANIDVFQPPYSADPTGATDTSAAFNAAIIAAGGGNIRGLPS